MLPATVDLSDCQGLAVPATVMRHVVQVESDANPFAIGVVGTRLVRQPTHLAEAIATVRMLEEGGYNYSLGLAQVNRANLVSYGLDTPEKAFDACANLRAGSQILAGCYANADGDWSKAFSCYYSGNFVTGFKDGYVSRIYATMKKAEPDTSASAVPVALSANSGAAAAKEGMARSGARAGHARDLIALRSASLEVAARSASRASGAVVSTLPGPTAATAAISHGTRRLSAAPPDSTDPSVPAAPVVQDAPLEPMPARAERDHAFVF